MNQHFDNWSEERVVKGDNISFIFTNKGNMWVDMRNHRGETLIQFQLPRIDIDKKVFFNLFADVYIKAFHKGIEVGKGQFSAKLAQLCNYGAQSELPGGENTHKLQNKARINQFGGWNGEG